MPEQITREAEPFKKEIWIGRDSFDNELTIVSERPLGKITRIESETESRGDSPSDQFTTTTKEIRFEDGEREVACRFVVEDTASTASELQVDMKYLSPDVRISELEEQSGKTVQYKPGHWGEHNLTKDKENK